MLLSLQTCNSNVAVILNICPKRNLRRYLSFLNCSFSPTKVYHKTRKHRGTGRKYNRTPLPSEWSPNTSYRLDQRRRPTAISGSSHCATIRDFKNTLCLAEWSGAVRVPSDQRYRSETGASVSDSETARWVKKQATIKVGLTLMSI